MVELHSFEELDKPWIGVKRVVGCKLGDLGHSGVPQSEPPFEPHKCGVSLIKYRVVSRNQRW